MLLKLTIQNYLLIQELMIDFSPGFSVITGETGAGKSILLGALGLILGQRNDSDVVLDKSRKCIIEGVFQIQGYHLESLFERNELDYDDQLIIRREISETGKSRSFVNDSPVNLAILKELGEHLVNIHSQNSIVTLNDSDFQLAVLDGYSGIQAEVTQYRSEYQQYVKAQKQLESLLLKEANNAATRDYDRFLLQELNAANLISGEIPELEERLSLLSNIGEVKGNLGTAIQCINDGETNILGLLNDVMHALEHASKYQSSLKPLIERLDSNYIDIKDLLSDIENAENHLEVDPDEMDKVSSRLDTLNRLLKKHQKSTIDELLAIKDSLWNKLNQSDHLDDLISGIRNRIDETAVVLMKMAEAVSEKRKAAIPGFEKEIETTLVQLGMPSSRFRIEMNQGTTLSFDGIDKVRFLFSANKGLVLNALNTSASGGESSRIMLSIKSMIGQKNLLPTIFFDEIDIGVSGIVASKVGSILQKMGRTMQVIAITHLPQIAARSNKHFFVYKIEKQNITISHIKQLSKEEQIEEIARMLSSEKVTDAALKNAIELLNN